MRPIPLQIILVLIVLCAVYADASCGMCYGYVYIYFMCCMLTKWAMAFNIVFTYYCDEHYNIQRVQFVCKVAINAHSLLQGRIAQR